MSDRKKPLKFEDMDSAEPVWFEDLPAVGGKKNTTATKQQPKCYESHPVLKVLNGTVIGGSCSTPVCKDADIYVGLDWGAVIQKPKYPWHPEKNQNVIEISFKISDGSAPGDKKEFAAMVDWLVTQLEAGKKVHIGCIGGHGRTGMLIAAIITKATGEKDSIKWVRTNYCKKAVESKQQVEFLTKDFGITPQEPSRQFTQSPRKSTDGGGTSTGWMGHYGTGGYQSPKQTQQNLWKDGYRSTSSYKDHSTTASSSGNKNKFTAKPLKGRSVWGKN